MQTQGVGVLGVLANTNARQGSGGKEPLWHNQLREQWSLHCSLDREGSHGPLPWRSAGVGVAVLSPLKPTSPCLLSPPDNRLLLQTD